MEKRFHTRWTFKNFIIFEWIGKFVNLYFLLCKIIENSQPFDFEKQSEIQHQIEQKSSQLHISMWILPDNTQHFHIKITTWREKLRDLISSNENWIEYKTLLLANYLMNRNIYSVIGRRITWNHDRQRTISYQRFFSASSQFSFRS